MFRRRFIPALSLILWLPLGAATGTNDLHTKRPKPREISHGQEVALAEYLVPGKTTVFDFFSPYCPDCEEIASKIEALHARRADVAVVLVNINRPGVRVIDWRSPVARQYDLGETPEFKIFGPDGKLQAEGGKARALVKSWLDGEGTVESGPVEPAVPAGS